MLKRTTSGKRNGQRLVVAIAAILFLVEVSVAAPGLAEVMDAKLSPGLRETSAVWDGENAYIFGGCCPFQDRILQYDSANDAVKIMDAKFPTKRESTCAIWDGENAYIFGGYDRSRIDQILRFSPDVDSDPVEVAKLPTGRSDIPNACVWDGENAYIFGGWDSTPASPLNQIVRYNPDSNTVTVMDAELPTGRYRVSAVWDSRDRPGDGCPDGCAYIFGGVFGENQQDLGLLDEIVQYNPTNDSVTVMTAKLPGDRQMTSAVWDGQQAYIFSGDNSTATVDEIVRYDPTTDTVNAMTAKLPSVRYSTSAVWDGIHAYVFGGWDGETCCLDEIVRYTPPEPPAAPQNFTAEVRHGEPIADLVWEAPSDDGGEPVTSYRVYRAVLPGGQFEFVEEVSGLSYSDDECPTVYLCSYEVAAVNVAGEGDRSDQTSIPETLVNQAAGGVP